MDPEITQEAQKERTSTDQAQPQDKRSQSKFSIPNYKETVALNKNQQTKQARVRRNPKFQVKEKLRQIRIFKIMRHTHKIIKGIEATHTTERTSCSGKDVPKKSQGQSDGKCLYTAWQLLRPPVRQDMQRV